MKKEKLDEILSLHKKWLSGDPDGVRANLSEADLREAKGTDTVITNESTAFFRLQCPEAGAYTAYKKAHGLIVELEIPADALRSSATSRKCRASKAKVISITDRDGNAAGVEEVESDHDAAFVYRVGETVSVPDFDTDRWNECAAGIHHFITRAEAVQYPHAAEGGQAYPKQPHGGGPYL